MNNILKVSLIVVAVLAFAGVLFIAGTFVGSSRLMRAFANPDGRPALRNLPGAPGAEQNDGRRGPGNPQQGGPRMPNRGPLGWLQGMGPGSMGRMPGGQQQGRNPTNLTPLTPEEATTSAQDYIASLGVDGLEVGAVLILQNRAYVAVKESATGLGAFELIISPMTREAHPMPGPATLWNLKYGGMLELTHRHKGFNPSANPTPDPNMPSPAATPASVSSEMPLSAEQAVEAAQKYLDTAYPGTTAASEALQFYGYYSIDFSREGEVIGKLTVNGYHGKVSGHLWRTEVVQ